VGVLAGVLVAAVAAGGAAGADNWVRVPKLEGKSRTHAEGLLQQRGLRYKRRAPSARYELPAGVDGTGDELSVVPEDEAPNRTVTGQEVDPGTRRPRGSVVQFSTSPLPSGHDRTPWATELESTTTGPGQHAITVSLARDGYSSSCRPLDHVDVAPRRHWILVMPFVNLTDGGGPCVTRRRTVSLDLGTGPGGKPILEDNPTPPRHNLFDVAASRWERVRLEADGRYAVVYFWGGLGCNIYSHAKVRPKGEKAALTLYDGNPRKGHDVVCPAVAVRYMALVRIPHALIGRPIVDGAKHR
jgi:hypothetical protein